MLENNELIKREILAHLALNDWLNKSPSHDYAIEFFYNFFSKKFEGLTRLHVEKLLHELEAAGLVELKLYSNNGVDVVLGLTRDGLNRVTAK